MTRKGDESNRVVASRRAAKTVHLTQDMRIVNSPIDDSAAVYK
jgi:hypothetical protein